MPIKEKKSRPIRNIFFVSLLVSVIYYFYQNQPEPSVVKVETVEAVPEPAPTENPAEVPGSTSGRVQELSPTLKHEVQKLNAYTYCLNRQSSRAMSSWSRYLSWVDPAEGPQVDSRHKYGVYTIYDLAPCQKRLREAEALPVKWPESEAAAATYEQALIALHALLEQAEEYYSQEDYEDDQMAKGKTMHTELMAAYHGYALADSVLRQSLIPHRRDIMLQFESDQLEAESPDLFHGLQLLGAAHMIMELSKQEDPMHIDTTALKEQLQAFELAMEQTEAWQKTAEQGGEKINHQLPNLLNNAERLQKETKKLIRFMRDYEPPRQSDSEFSRRLRSIRLTTRYRAEVIRTVGAYNSFVSGFNRLAPFRTEVPYPQWPTELFIPKGMTL